MTPNLSRRSSSVSPDPQEVDLPESSISQKLPSSNTAQNHPKLLHTLHVDKSSAVLSVAASRDHIFSGSQTFEISAWDRSTFQLVGTLTGHDGAVGTLLVVEERGWLMSSGVDGTIRIWNLLTFLPLLIIYPINSGTVFSLVFCSETSVLYIGCQSTAIQWIHLPSTIPSPNILAAPLPTPFQKSSRFFDSLPPTPKGSPKPTSKPFRSDKSDDGSRDRTRDVDELVEKVIPCMSVGEGEMKSSAHYGYVYALVEFSELCAGKNGGPAEMTRMLASGSGAGDVKIWDRTDGTSLELLASFPGDYEAVLSLAVSDQTLYAGMQDGGIKVLDLETKSVIRTIVGHEAAILSLSRLGSDLYSSSADGRISRWNSSFDCTASFQGHRGAILSSVGCEDEATGKDELYTAGSDGLLQVWTVGTMASKQASRRDGESEVQSGDILLHTLTKLIAFPTVPNDSHREDCRQGAIFLKRTFNQLGAESTLLSGAAGKNPLVLATFKGREVPGKKKKRVLFYGHYDVVLANPDKWTSDPWKLVGRNGYLYGRGVADNKGPILAIATAASALLERRALDVDLVMLIEGEEEAGSDGFHEAVRRNKELIGEIDCILVSNSYWIEETRPCITYGLRGVVHVSIEISSNKPDLHSGVEGGAAPEPMIDMIRLLNTLTDDAHRISIPHFYDAVRPVDPVEQARYKSLSALTGRSALDLKKRFSEPSFSVGNVGIGTGGSPTIIPSCVKSSVSFRLVPDQDLDTIVDSIVSFIRTSYARLASTNAISIKVPHRANWWLGDLSSPEYLLMEKCVGEVWGVAEGEVLRIREGGSIPSIPFLEKEFSARAIHLPLGQSSDNGHLQDERLRLLNLRNGQSVFSSFLERI